MKKQKIYLPSSDGINTLHCIHWAVEAPVAVLQIVHGMTEYIERYDEFASFLADNHIAVIGHDHLGHGETASTPDDFGFFHSRNGAKYLVQDARRITLCAKELYPNVPIFVLGHSMGSFCVRNYMTVYNQGIAGFVLMGTGHPSKLIANFAQGVAAMRIKQKGERYRSQLVAKLVFFQYMKGIKHPITSVDWISRDGEITKKYLETPYCTFTFTLRGYEDLFCMIHNCIYEVDFKSVPKDMPIFITSGKCDPVGEWGKGPEKLYSIYQKRNMKQVSVKLYEEMRHEILNELGRDVVYDDILNWMKRYID